MMDLDIPPAIKKQIELMINEAWKSHDAAFNQGDEKMAEFYKQAAFELLEKLPENAVYLKMPQ